MQVNCMLAEKNVSHMIFSWYILMTKHVSDVDTWLNQIWMYMYTYISKCLKHNKIQRIQSH